MTSRHAPATLPAAPATAPPGERRRLLLAYAGLCLLCWTLYGVAVTDWQRPVGQHLGRRPGAL